jgi:hypothetical protein
MEGGKKEKKKERRRFFYLGSWWREKDAMYPSSFSIPGYSISSVGGLFEPASGRKRKERKKKNPSHLIA